MNKLSISDAINNANAQTASCTQCGWIPDRSPTGQPSAILVHHVVSDLCPSGEWLDFDGIPYSSEVTRVGVFPTKADALAQARKIYKCNN